MYGEALVSYFKEKYLTSAILCAVLYEKIFTTRLVNEIANPRGFVPSKDNIQEQLQNQLNQEEEIIETSKLRFCCITKKLVELNVIKNDEKLEYDNFYTDIRNPVSHGLSLRLYKKMIGRTPTSTFEIDTNYEEIYQRVAKLLIEKIYELMVVKVLRKK